MKKNRLYMILFAFVMFFCVNIIGVKADSFSLTLGKNSDKISFRLAGAPDTDFNSDTSISCEVNVQDDNDITVSRCTYSGYSAYYNNSYSFKGNGKKGKINAKITNKKNNNNSLRMTIFKASCKKPNATGNNYVCTITNMTFKWEKHDECNNSDRSGNNNGIPGVIACVGGSSIFCDKYKNMKNSEIKSECPGAYGDDNNLKKKDILKKCETMDSVAFDRWCKYGKNGGRTHNRDAVPDIKGYKYKSTDYDVNKAVTCSKLLGDDNVKLIHRFMLYLCIAGVIIVIVLGSTDFVKAIASSDDDALKTAGKRLKYRIISVIILLLLPALVNFILSFADDNFYLEVVDKNGDVTEKKDISVKLGKASDCGF